MKSISSQVLVAKPLYMLLVQLYTGVLPIQIILAVKGNLEAFDHQDRNSTGIQVVVVGRSLLHFEQVLLHSPLILSHTPQSI